MTIYKDFETAARNLLDSDIDPKEKAYQMQILVSEYRPQTVRLMFSVEIETNSAEMREYSARFSVLHSLMGQQVKVAFGGRIQDAMGDIIERGKITLEHVDIPDRNRNLFNGS